MQAEIAALKQITLGDRTPMQNLSSNGATCCRCRCRLPVFEMAALKLITAVFNNTNKISHVSRCILIWGGKAPPLEA
eukprot:4227353-Karenia_brevis.AAC.1